MIALLAALRSLGGWILQNVLDPRFWAVLAIVWGVGWVMGLLDEKKRSEAFVEASEAIGRAQEERTRIRNLETRKNKQETEIAHAKEIQKRKAQYDELTSRYLDLNGRFRVLASAHSSIVPGNPTSPGEPVQAGQTVCFDRDRLNASVVASLDRFAKRVDGITERLGKLIQRGNDGLDDARWWGEWARKNASCPSSTQ